MAGFLVNNFPGSVFFNGKTFLGVDFQGRIFLGVEKLQPNVAGESRLGTESFCCNKNKFNIESLSMNVPRNVKQNVMWIRSRAE